MIELIGHLHPLLVHLPIGVLVLALVFSLLPAAARNAMGPAFNTTLLVAAVSSVAACIAGYILSNSGDYDEALASKHQWLGIATSLCIIATWLIRKYKREALWLTVIVMAIASHMGGTLTHGEGYLLPSSKKTEAIADSAETFQDSIFRPVVDTITKTAAVTQVFIYRDEITPILKNKCYNCHSSLKKKGGLRLDSESFINKGGKNGEVLVKGDPNNSPMYTNLLLPLDDDKHMPPKGKKQLSSSEIKLIHRWIKEGAPFGPISITPGSPVQSITSLPTEQPDIPPSPAVSKTLQEEKKTIEIPAADESIIQSMRDRGIIVEKISEGSNQLSVNFVNVKSLDASLIGSLDEMKEQVTILKFTGQPLTDELLKQMPPMKRLERLHLEKTAVTDAGMNELKKFSNLQSVNLYGTRVSDPGLAALSNCNSLKKIYVWNTGISEQGIKTFKAKNPDVDVDQGQLSLKTPDSTKKN
ncbi:MAG TPA: c-type cytochrome domain-containing protein [Chitinophagaceae bacterium]|nr:c-type cytochrome domain-containing protein [Chitinophagaceae bacterium]